MAGVVGLVGVLLGLKGRGEDWDACYDINEPHYHHFPTITTTTNIITKWYDEHYHW